MKLLNFIDVGSIGGMTAPWSTDNVGFLLNFDPMQEPQTSESVLTLQTALWESSGSRPFHIYQGFNGTGSSFFQQNREYVKEHFDELRTRGPKELAETWFDRGQLVRTDTISCQRLDDVVQEHCPDVQFDFLKIDAQGAELPILRGAEKLVTEQIIGIEAELFNVPLYKGIALVDEVTKWLADRGFRVAYKAPPHGTFDSQNDFLFLKGNGPIQNFILDLYQNPRPPQKPVIPAKKAQPAQPTFFRRVVNKIRRTLKR